MKSLQKVGWLLMLLGAFSLAVMPVMAAEKSKGETLFEQRCSMCHATSRALEKTKSAKEWRQTVTRMQGYAGGRISDEEAEIITEYLVEGRGK
jgi:mono/diheme cytochrome c family protein